MALEVGQVFAGYTILRVLGAGGMGQVYLVAHPRLPREDALKVLPGDLTTDSEYRARFVREADLAGEFEDLVLVKPQQDAPDGSIVVALVGEEATVKRLDRSTGRIRLLAENPAYEPIVPAEATMVGLVRGLLRTF